VTCRVSDLQLLESLLPTVSPKFLFVFSTGLTDYGIRQIKWLFPIADFPLYRYTAFTLSSGTPKDGKKTDTSFDWCLIWEMHRPHAYEPEPIHLFLESISLRRCQADGTSDILQHRVFFSDVN